MDFLGPRLGLESFSDFPGLAVEIFAVLEAGEAGILLSLFLTSAVVAGETGFVDGMTRLVRAALGVPEDRGAVVGAFDASLPPGEAVVRLESGLRSVVDALPKAVRRVALLGDALLSGAFAASASEDLFAVPETVGFLFSDDGTDLLLSSIELIEALYWCEGVVVGGFRAVEDARGRAGGLLRLPPGAGLVAVVERGFANELGIVVTGRFAVVRGLLGGTEDFLGDAVLPVYSLTASASGIASSFLSSSEVDGSDVSFSVEASMVTTALVEESLPVHNRWEYCL